MILSVAISIGLALPAEMAAAADGDFFNSCKSNTGAPELLSFAPMSQLRSTRRDRDETGKDDLDRGLGVSRRLPSMMCT